VDYGKTLNLPKTKFPMRANLSSREPEIQSYWEEKKIYERLLEKNKNNEKFILHDGPPYANGDIHLGTALNKILKDIIVRFKGMNGYYTPYIPGWDTHGLPIEHQVVKNMGGNRHAVDEITLRRKCHDYALSFVDKQREQFKRLGVLGDWQNPYLTLKPEYEAKQISVFGEMAKKGYIYKGLKPVYWCASCETALAEAEVEYDEKKSPSIYVKFPLLSDVQEIFSSAGRLKDKPVFVLIWTTTPWTLPANLAVAVHPDFEYALVETNDEYFIMAKELVEEVMGLNNAEYEIISTAKGKDLELKKCLHPFIDRESLLVNGDHVTLEQGTGCVHTAPGHGHEDYLVSLQYKLPVLTPVNSQGVFTEEAGKFAGLFYDKANKEIVNELKERGMLWHFSFIKHQYAHCWRCKQPVIYRATEQWFASVEGFRKEALDSIKQVEWIPSWGEDRITNMVSDRADWCISRQRVWGVPIPIFYCQKCGKEIVNDETLKVVEELFAKEGSDSWFIKEPKEILPEGYNCPHCGSAELRKETDIMDVWFDSGSSHAAVLTTRPELRWPADLYLEGSDQHRGWFQSSLLTAVATRGSAPYKAVLTHGFVVDGEGKKMSKSLGNVIYPQDVIKQYGADILRLWVVSADYRGDIRVSQEILKQMSEIYRKIRNTCRFMLGNLYDFDPARDMVSDDQLFELDRWALMRLQQLVEKVNSAYNNYEFHVFYHAVHNFCVLDMSSFYLDILKDRLYTSKAESVERRAAQTVMYKIIRTLVRLIAPVISHTAEEIWKYLPEDRNYPESVFLSAWPEVEKKYLNEQLNVDWELIRQVRKDVAKALEIARQNKIIGHSLDASVKLYGDEKISAFLRRYAGDLANIFIVSKVELGAGPAVEGSVRAEEVEGLQIYVEQAKGVKCPRCWIYSEEIRPEQEGADICPRCSAVLAEQ
jgi:isoleucyl-tRNA synthetase